MAADSTPFLWKRWAVFAAKLVILLVVAVGIGRAVWVSLDQFREQKISLADIHWGWFAACGSLYLLGMAPACFFWHRTLWAMGQRPAFWESLRAFYLSQLGKYVPGKAMVVVLRSAAIASDRVDPVVAAVSVFVETLTMMAAGALVATAILAGIFHEHTGLMLIALGLMALAGVPTAPPIFKRVVKLLRVKKANPKIDEALDGITWRLMLEGWLIDGAGWCVMGLSLWTALRATPGLDLSQLYTVESLLLVIASMALATVAGFLSLIPGGFGVRDLVVVTLIGVQFGSVAAIVSAVLMRLASLLAEVGVSGLLYLIRPPTPVESSTASQAEVS
ncbi:lysylphosphatidylglycerol synthase transmembrane domain-containing protein [Lignipirellula cremea]|uniref:Flippase-like domain-containing protein n=1 Tax=Lignipirellula cremea TaxID=2528010 RepID=A0A518DX58_9BACT|nr:lysylphosphatidylglycerol synthase domain-containing protein [Lignipirellula cremea]QDU96402.1 hypothetical protein Pla8534_42220 [Lignipirellula cremea]